MRITVFLADDHTVVREGLRFLLESQPDICVIGEAANGRDAVRGVSQLHPDVVVMDIGMPELNGVEAARAIKQSDPSTQIVILSMHASTEHIYRALESGAQGYLLKESAGAEVVAAIRAVHCDRRYLSQKISDRLVDESLVQRRAGLGQRPLERLSEREREVLQLTVEGRPSLEIAHILSLSPKTVETYRSRLMGKLGIHDLPGLVKFAIQHGLISLD